MKIPKSIAAIVNKKKSLSFIDVIENNSLVL